MAPMYSVTTEEGLAAYLFAKDQPAKSIERLRGGTANYVYRVTDASDITTIYKHAADHLASNPAFKFAQQRMDYEAHILKHIISIESTSPADSTHAVKLLGYDAAFKVLNISDGGRDNLKSAYEWANLDIPDVASDLAAWLANLHTRTLQFPLVLECKDKAGAIGNNAVAVDIYRHSYMNLHHALERFGFDAEIAAWADGEYGALLKDDDECLCHGDFWPGNVLVDPRMLDSPNRRGNVRVDLVVVDWEMVRRGCSATDVAQFAAEAFLLDRFHGNKELRPQFLTAYLKHRNAHPVAPPIGRQWIRRLAIHWAVHVAFWPTVVKWTTEPETKVLVQIGVDVLNAVMIGNIGGLKRMPLFEGMGSEWDDAFLRD